MSYQLALIDMDGTVYSGENPIENVNKGLNCLKENIDDIFFLTNYAGTKRESYRSKLDKMGIDASAEDVVTSGWLTAKYIAQRYSDSEVFVLGEEGLKEEIREQEVKVSEDCDSPEILVVSNKHDLRYDDLTEVLRGIDEETLVLGTNPDETIPGEEGEIPGAGTIIQTVETMTGKEAEIIGKPSQNAVKTVLEMKDAEPEDCIIIGDRLNTDILMGNQNEMETALVLTGVTDEKEAKNSEIRPDYILHSIAEISKIF